jgi:hypothetical protein
MTPTRYLILACLFLGACSTVGVTTPKPDPALLSETGCPNVIFVPANPTPDDIQLERLTSAQRGKCYLIKFRTLAQWVTKIYGTPSK